MLSTGCIEYNRLTSFRVIEFQETNIGNCHLTLVGYHDRDDVVSPFGNTQRLFVAAILKVTDQKHDGATPDCLVQML